MHVRWLEQYLAIGGNYSKRAYLKNASKQSILGTWMTKAWFHGFKEFLSRGTGLQTWFWQSLCHASATPAGSVWRLPMDVSQGQENVLLVAMFVISESLVVVSRVVKSSSSSPPHPVGGKQTLFIQEWGVSCRLVHQADVILGTGPPLSSCANLDGGLT